MYRVYYNSVREKKLDLKLSCCIVETTTDDKQNLMLMERRKRKIKRKRDNELYLNHLIIKNNRYIRKN